MTSVAPSSSSSSPSSFPFLVCLQSIHVTQWMCTDCVWIFLTYNVPSDYKRLSSPSFICWSKSQCPSFIQFPWTVFSIWFYVKSPVIRFKRQTWFCLSFKVFCMNKKSSFLSIRFIKVLLEGTSLLWFFRSSCSLSFSFLFSLCFPLLSPTSLSVSISVLLGSPYSSLDFFLVMESFYHEQHDAEGSLSGQETDWMR